MNEELPQIAYGGDLAFIHDAGFGEFAQSAAQTLLTLLRAGDLRGGLVVDLGCGSGILSSAAAKAGYDVLGYDISPHMVKLSRSRVRRGTFRRAAVLDAEIPPCVAVAAVGEIFNYLFDRRHSLARLTKLFHRVHRALVPGGVFLFDVALVGRVPERRRRSYTEADDWACLFEAEEDARGKLLTRRITTFRKVGGAFRRAREVHTLQLFERHELLAPLRKMGFRVRTVRRYGELSFPPGYAGFIARKS